MFTSPIEDLDLVRLISDIPDYDLKADTLGMVRAVNKYHQIYAVEFVDEQGEEIITLPVPRCAIKPFVPEEKK